MLGEDWKIFILFFFGSVSTKDKKDQEGGERREGKIFMGYGEKREKIVEMNREIRGEKIEER